MSVRLYLHVYLLTSSLLLEFTLVTAPPEAGLESVCNKCHELQSLVKNFDADRITSLADRQQASGDQRSASRTMCGGICLGRLILDGGAFSNLGVLLKEQGLLIAALACYRTACRLQPKVAGHHYRM
jgi:hypothetical protein